MEDHIATLQISSTDMFFANAVLSVVLHTKRAVIPLGTSTLDVKCVSAIQECIAFLGLMTTSSVPIWEELYL